MRTLIALLLLATPASAWQATLGPICTLTTETERAKIELTYDPTGPLYSITVERLDGVWSVTPYFAMRFDGGRPRTISTNRHQLGQGGAALTVMDRGFGNVLDGIEFNDVATAYTDGQMVVIPLAGAAPEVQKFRDCVASPIA
ncbi:MAG: hypothetical protein HRU32_09755 [Rhodobacteraceae bacterium]|nr:hypothetical protein [Paracoccaceae bacterium]